jgi:hypothetical protein
LKGTMMITNVFYILNIDWQPEVSSLSYFEVEKRNAKEGRSARYQRRHGVNTSNFNNDTTTLRTSSRDTSDFQKKFKDFISEF